MITFFWKQLYLLLENTILTYRKVCDIIKISFFIQKFFGIFIVKCYSNFKYHDKNIDYLIERQNILKVYTHFDNKLNLLRERKGKNYENSNRI